MRSSQKTKVEKTKSVVKKVQRTVVIDPTQIKPEEFHLIGHLHDSFHGKQAAHHESAQYLAGNKLLGKSYKVNIPGQKAQKIKFTRATTVCKKVEINPAALTAEQSEWLAYTLVGHSNVIQAGHTALAAIPHATKSQLISYRPMVFTKDVVINDVVVIDPSDLNAQTSALLTTLLSSNKNQQFFDAVNNVTKVPVRYLVAVIDPAKPDAVVYQPVSLTRSLVGFDSVHAQGERRFAVCDAKPLGAGIEGAVYLSTATIKPVVDADGDFKFVCKTKPDPKKARVVKQMSPPRAEDGELKRLDDGSLLDPRSQNMKAKREGGFLQRMTIFHAKSAVLSADDSRAALIMKRIQGKDWMDCLIEDCGQFDASDKYIPGTGNIFTVDQRIEMSIMVGEAIMVVHSEGIVHRDIKPENIVMELDANNNPISASVVDFGLAKHDGEVGIVENCGSLDYAAPEIFKGSKHTKLSDACSFTRILKNILWQALSSDRYNALSSAERAAIKNILTAGTDDNANTRASVADVVKVFKDIKAGRQEKLRPACKMN